MSSIDKLIVPLGLSLREYLTKMDEGKSGILLLVDSGGKLLRTITDGDLRRLLLEGIELDNKDYRFPLKNPITASDDMSRRDLLQEMQKHEINHIPIVNAEGKPTAIVHLRDIESPVLLSTPHMGEQELEFVNQAFDTNWIAPLGPNVDAFENELADKVGIQHAAALSSGTAAIHLALVLLGVKHGDNVFCSSLTFVASANPILYQGATPIFIDAEPDSWNMSPLALENALIEAEKNGELPKAVIVVNLYGQSADMDAILTLCDRYEIPVVEDAAESLGATYKGKSSGTLGKIGIYSFNGNKIITTSGGGMMVSDDGELIEKARFLSTQARDPAPYYLHSHVGYNYRMSNVLAGIGRGQLRVLDERVNARRKIFKFYQEHLTDVKAISWMPEASFGISNRWLTCAVLDDKQTDLNVKQLLEKLSKENIEGRHIWRPMHMQPLFKNCKYYQHNEQDDISESIFNTGICLPSGSNMSESQQLRVISVLKDYLK